MALKNLSSNQLIYEKGSVVDEIALIIKGSVVVNIGSETLTLDVGSIIGLSERVGEEHRFTYMSKGETILYTYPHTDPDDYIERLIENEKLAPTITLSMIKNAAGLLSLSKNLHQKARDDFDKLHSDLKDYQMLCAKTGNEAKDFSALNDLASPEFAHTYTDWKADFFRTLSNKYKLMSPIYSLGLEVCIGFAVWVEDFLLELSNDVDAITKSIDSFHKETHSFKTEIAKLSNEAIAIEAGEDVMVMPSFEDSLSQIVMYADFDEESARSLESDIKTYSEYSDRTETSDELRVLRRRISTSYYNLYKACLLQYIKTNEMPAVVKMFFLFGYLDERLASSDDIQTLYGLSCAYRYNGDKIVPIYEWLKKVYLMEVDPSMNEFQQDYPAFLKESKRNGDITDDEMKDLLTDPMSRLDFEIKNLFTHASRMTFGRVSIFTPVFDSQVRMLPLTKSYLSDDVVSSEISRIRGLDYSIFYRTRIFNLPTNESVQFFLHQEQVPYIILLPNVGQNIILWQTIEGRVRNSPGRFLTPIFLEENIEDTFTKAFGDYRWEVCKTDQGVRWTDITDPSLTAEYHDFLQFYKKNSALSKTQKEAVKAKLKKFSNNYKKAFINDYLTYIKFESAGTMKLLKPIRETLFKYCSFKSETRDQLSHSPQYEKLIEIRNNKTEQKIRPLQNVILKEENKGHEIPVELYEEIKFFEG